MKIACDECNGTGRFTKGGGDNPCPWCSETGLVDLDYAVYGQGHNGDFAWRELYDVCRSVADARRVAENAMRGRFENTLEDGTPTLTCMTIEGPGDGEDEQPTLMHVDGGTTPVWSGRTDQQIADAVRRIDQKAGEQLLGNLQPGTTFKLDSRAGRAYRSVYVVNGQFLCDQVKGTCESPFIYNMSPSSLGFAVPFHLLKEALS